MRKGRQEDTAKEARIEHAARLHVRFQQADFHRPEISATDLEDAERFLGDPANHESMRLVGRVADHVERWRRQGLVITNRGTDQDGESATFLEGNDPGMYSRAGRLSLGRTIGLARAAVLAAAIAIGVGMHEPARQAADPSIAVFATRSGENKQLTLPDGTRAILGAETQLTFRLVNDRRVIHLSRGEAFFKVAHDPAHPFTVEAGGGSVTAVGTEFNVRRDLDRVTVTVTEGAVFVTPGIQGIDGANKSPLPIVRWQPVRLEKGQAVTYDESHDRGRVETVDDAATGWTRGMFDYLDVPLKYVVADLNRYRATPIEFADVAAGEYEFSGTVFLDRTDQWLLSLERILPLRVSDDKTNDRVFIGSRPDPGAAPSPP